MCAARRPDVVGSVDVADTSVTKTMFLEQLLVLTLLPAAVCNIYTAGGDQPAAAAGGLLDDRLRLHAVGAPSIACLRLLLASCPGLAQKSCGLCTGRQQHELREAGCTAAFVQRYCESGGAQVVPSGRGVGDGKSQRLDDMRLLSGMGWWYNWGLSPDPSSSTTARGQEFVAMAWGGQHKHEPLKKYLEDWIPHPSTKHLLGFNEPNLRHQSNLSASAACALWPEMISAAKQHNMGLGSPAANHCTPGGSGSQDANCFLAPEDWFDAFFAQPGCGLDTVDFITTHKCARMAAQSLVISCGHLPTR